MIAAAIHCNAANYLRVNQIGYLVDDVKVAVIMMEHGDAPTSFCVVNADSGKKTVMHSVKPTGEFAGFAQTARRGGLSRRLLRLQHQRAHDGRNSLNDVVPRRAGESRPQITLPRHSHKGVHQSADHSFINLSYNGHIAHYMIS